MYYTSRLATSLVIATAAYFLASGPVTASPVATAAVRGKTLSAKPAAAAGPVMVKISNFTFGPKEVTVKVGQTITWTNDDDIPHTVVATDKSFRSKVLDTGQSFSFTFTKPGQIAYFCSLHPMMTGKVNVAAK
jgi:plastocyanin